MDGIRCYTNKLSACNRVVCSVANQVLLARPNAVSQWLVLADSMQAPRLGAIRFSGNLLAIDILFTSRAPYSFSDLASAEHARNSGRLPQFKYHDMYASAQIVAGFACTLQ